MKDHKIKAKRVSKKKEVAKEKKALSDTCLEQMNRNAAGIDVGSRAHYVAVPSDRDEAKVKRFACYTPDIEAMAEWLKRCGIETVAMESTGVYWLPVYEILSARGLEVRLVNARQVRNVSGRKSDVSDCEWVQQLHTYGLLQGAFIPDLKTGELKSYVKQRESLLREMGKHINQMQKALVQMNLQLHTVVRDITGVTGMRIIRLIVAGERDPKVLAACRDGRCKKSEEAIEKSLIGNYRKEHVFRLKQLVELYDFYQTKLKECDEAIEAVLRGFDDQGKGKKPLKEKTKQSKAARRHTPDFDVREVLYQTTGVDLTDIPGVSEVSALKVIATIGTDMTRWPSEKHFASWLSLSPNNKISGERVLSSRTSRSNNLAAATLRLSAQTLYKSQTALGAYYRRLRARIGAPKAITATARKIACLIYRMLKNKMAYEEVGQGAYEQRYKKRVVRSLKQKAEQLGYQLLPLDPGVSSEKTLLNQEIKLSY